MRPRCRPQGRGNAEEKREEGAKNPTDKSWHRPRTRHRAGARKKTAMNLAAQERGERITLGGRSKRVLKKKEREGLADSTSGRLTRRPLRMNGATQRAEDLHRSTKTSDPEEKSRKQTKHLAKKRRLLADISLPREIFLRLCRGKVSRKLRKEGRKSG